MEAKQKIRRNAHVDQALCVACGCCMKVCPLSAISVFRGLWAQVDGSKCVKECPASVIKIQEVRK